MQSIRRVPLRLGILAALCAASTSLGFAATIRYQSDAELIARSDRVVRGRVIATRGERAPNGRIYTVTTLEVLEDFSGQGDSIVEIRELGGTVGGEVLYVGGAVQYAPGSEVVVCLERAPGGWLRSVAMRFSKFDVIPTGAAGDGDAILRRNMADTIVAGNVQALSVPRLSTFRELAERVRGVRSVSPIRTREAVGPVTVAEPFTYFGIRWIEPDSGTAVRWYIDSSAPPPVPGNGAPELQTALAGWTNPPQASIVLSYGGFTDQPDSNTRGTWGSLGEGAGVVFFEDPENEISGSVLAIGGGTAFGNGGVVNGVSFSRQLSGFVIFQNAGDLPANFRQSQDFTRVLLHEVGHGIGLGHTNPEVANGTRNIMYPSCCWSDTPVAPSIGADDLAGLMFLYPMASSCSFSLSPTSTTLTSLASSFSVNVSTGASCSWTVSGAPSWAPATPLSGTGNGSIQFSVSSNLTTSTRSATISIGTEPFVLTQGACAATVTPTSANVPARGGAAVFSVSSSSCQWTAASSASWITVSSGASGSGNGSVTLTADRNSGGPRSGTAVIAGRVVTISQPDGSTANIISDFNGDGRPDFVWHHQTDGRIAIWHMNGTTLISADSITPDRVVDTNWKIVGVWDPNADGLPDLLWRHATSGSLGSWRMRGLAMQSGDSLTPGMVADPGWAIVSLADMNRDGHLDLIWQHTNGSIATWLMRGTASIEARSLSPATVADTNWRIVGSGDFDANGHADLVWHHQTNGQAAVWFMNGTTMVSATLVSPAGVTDTNWKIRSVADVNLDGHPDLVWQNVSTGYIGIWLMRGLTMTSGVNPSTAVVPDTAWRIVGPR
jgi:hypothetical protein